MLNDGLYAQDKADYASYDSGEQDAICDMQQCGWLLAGPSISYDH
jgi:hypothetical protein